MVWWRAAVLLVAVLNADIVLCLKPDELEFPAGFKFGAASSAYQIEGATEEEGKSENVWDRGVLQPGLIVDGSDANVACDSYHLWRRDVEMVKELGLHFYRFSIAWTRILPNGFANHINEEGVKYYNDLIDELLRNDIEPVVTIFHFDLPQKLQDLGGWINPLITNWFSDYARVAYTAFGDRVQTWLTINEPIILCDLSYNSGMNAQNIIDPEATYICSKNVLMAHAKAWRVYDAEFRHKFQGQVSFANQLFWYEPATVADKELAELAIQLSAGLYSHPVYSKEGGWPPVIEKLVAQYSSSKGFTKSLLPAFTEEERELVKGTFDFYGLNHYTSRVVRRSSYLNSTHVWPLTGSPELGAVLETGNWPLGENQWLAIYPEGIRRQLVWLKEQYGNISIIVTENGYASSQLGLDDQPRVNYIKQYLKQVLLAIKKDYVNVTAYTAWTLMDNFEWQDGYRIKFGLYEVDFSSPERTRTLRKSALYYKDIIKHHSLNVPTKYSYDEVYALAVLLVEIPLW